MEKLNKYRNKTTLKARKIYQKINVKIQIWFSIVYVIILRMFIFTFYSPRYY
jgi:hypothetical protein